jgi:hypothetical protein
VVKWGLWGNGDDGTTGRRMEGAKAEG